jgi:Fe-S oxidoreductase
MPAITPLREAADIVKEEGGEALDLCYQCGLCTGTCPWNNVKVFSPHKLMHQAQLGLIDFNADEMWICSTCKACVDRCPRGVELIDVMRAMRRAIVELSIGGIPDSLRLTAKNIGGTGNPLGEPQEKRADWAKELSIKPFTKDMELLYFPGCLACYDPNIMGISKATVTILNKAGTDYGILGTEEVCCGEAIRKAGNEGLFQNLVQQNITSFTEHGVRRILVTSPHCLQTFTQEYPKYGANFDVIHHSQLLLELIKKDKITFAKEVNKKVIYHDPCYLGRHNDIYEEPREILRNIPGVELIEFPDSGPESLCCGGGAGGLWLETKKGERLCDLKMEQAIELEADILAVACPYCMSMFKDSQLTVPKGDSLQIMDISELIQEAM